MVTYVKIPVVCQNGHRAFWTLEINGIDVREHAPPRDTCDCSKWEIGEGWRAAGGRPLWFSSKPDRSRPNWQPDWLRG